MRANKAAKKKIEQLNTKQVQLKEAEEEAMRANEAASGARCEESGHIKVR